MMIEVERVIPQDELIESIRGVSLLNNPDILPYENADISIEEIELGEISPTSLYVVRRGLQIQRDLRETLRDVGSDPLFLDGGLRLRDGDSNVGLIPPIVEDDPEYGLCLLDGAHRIYMARQIGLKVINVVLIGNVHQSAPMYAYPNEWDEIKEYDETPSDPALKKRYRDGYRGLYRDMSAINGSKMREPSTSS